MVFATIISTASLYILFGNFCLNAFGTGNASNALVTNFLEKYIGVGDSTPVDGKIPFMHYLLPDIIILFFMSNLVFTYPL